MASFSFTGLKQRNNYNNNEKEHNKMSCPYSKLYDKRIKTHRPVA